MSGLPGYDDWLQNGDPDAAPGWAANPCNEIERNDTMPYDNEHYPLFTDEPGVKWVPGKIYTVWNHDFSEDHQVSDYYLKMDITTEVPALSGYKICIEGAVVDSDDGSDEIYIQIDTFFELPSGEVVERDTEIVYSSAEWDLEGAEDALRVALNDEHNYALRGFYASVDFEEYM